jgi:hypothetical protein
VPMPFFYFKAESHVYFQRKAIHVPQSFTLNSSISSLLVDVQVNVQSSLAVKCTEKILIMHFIVQSIYINFLKSQIYNFPLYRFAEVCQV